MRRLFKKDLVRTRQPNGPNRNVASTRQFWRKFAVLALLLHGLGGTCLAGAGATYPPNQITVGGGIVNSGGVWGPSAQISFDHRIPQQEGLFGFGGFFDIAWIRKQQYYTGPAFWLHFFGGLRLWSSFGVTYLTTYDFGIRTGASYDFFLGPVGIGPGVLVDLLNARLGIRGEINLSLVF